MNFFYLTRIENCEIVLKLRPYSRNELEIRYAFRGFFSSHFSQLLVSFNNSFIINSPGNNSVKKILLKILERLVDGGYLKNNRQLVVKFNWSRNSRFLQDVCSMTNLEKLYLWDCELALEKLPQLFCSCPKLCWTDLKTIYMYNAWNGWRAESPTKFPETSTPWTQRLQDSPEILANYPGNNDVSITLYFSTNNDINFFKTLFKTLNAN